MFFKRTFQHLFDTIYENQVLSRSNEEAFPNENINFNFQDTHNESTMLICYSYSDLYTVYCHFLHYVRVENLSVSEPTPPS